MRTYRLLLFCVACLSVLNTTAQIEPLNWWVGMKNPNLQLLVHETNIGESKASIQYPGVTIKKQTPGDSKNYLFLDLVIAANTKPGTFKINFTKDGKSVYKADYTLLARAQGSASLQGFNSSDVMYLITPDRFANGDESNDVNTAMREKTINRKMDGGRHGGDLRGIIDHLDYIAGMGFTAIWPTPVLENDMEKYSYHGYSITNHYKVDPRFGTLDEYKELSTKARAKGIKLIYDEVLNHTGSYYWWMNDLPFKDWINYPDTLIRSSHRRTVNQDKYASGYDRDRMLKGWFDRTMPDMNGANSFCGTYLIQNSVWWIETLQLGGIRQDTYCYSDKDFLTRWSCTIMNEYPNFSLVGEEWSLNPLITSYWQSGKNNSDGYKSCLGSVMCFPLQSALINSLNDKEENKWEEGMVKLYEELANDFAYPNPEKTLVFADNHDMDRIYTQLNDNIALTKMAQTYILTVRGIPQLFYGDEILMTNTGHHKVDGLIRSDFPGGWKGDSVNGFTGQGLRADQKDMQDYLRKLLNWRKTSQAIQNGKTLHFVPFNKVYVYFRYTNQETVMIVVNKNKTETTVDSKRMEEFLGAYSTGRNVMTGEMVALNASFKVAGETVSVFELKKKTDE